MARKRRSSTRRKRTIARRTNRRVRRKSPVIRSRKRRSSRRRSSALVVRGSRRVARRVTRRRSSRRSGGIGGAITLRSLMDKQTLQLAGGAVGSSIITGLVINKFGTSLPGLSGPSATPWAAVAYQLLIPFGGAYLLRKHAPGIAKGILIGGVASAIQSTLAITGIQNQINALTSSGTTAGTGQYLDATNGVSALPPGYDGVDAFGASPYQSDSAFAGSAW